MQHEQDVLEHQPVRMPFASRMPRSTLHLRQQRPEHRPQLVIDFPRFRPRHPAPIGRDEPMVQAVPAMCVVDERPVRCHVLGELGQGLFVLPRVVGGLLPCAESCTDVGAHRDPEPEIKDCLLATASVRHLHQTNGGVASEITARGAESSHPFQPGVGKALGNGCGGQPAAAGPAVWCFRVPDGWRVWRNDQAGGCRPETASACERGLRDGCGTVPGGELHGIAAAWDVLLLGLCCQRSPRRSARPKGT